MIKKSKTYTDYCTKLNVTGYGYTANFLKKFSINV